MYNSPTNFLRILIFLIAWVPLRLWGQNPEYLYTHFDKEFYVAGEDIWFSVHFLDPLEQRSQIVYVELFSPEGKEILRHTLKVEQNQALGDFVLPANLAEGYYSFRAYTLWNLNFSPAVFFHKQIPVYNAIRDIKTLPILDKESTYTASQHSNLTLSLDKQVYEPRESVKVSLSTSLADLSHVSVSVTDLRYISTPQQSILPAYLQELSQQTAPTFSGRKYEAETSLKRTFYLQDPENKQAVNSNFIMGFVKLTHQKLTRVAAEGVVDFPLDNFYDTTVIQIFDANPFLPTYIPLITPIEEKLELPPPILKKESPPLSEHVKYYLLEYQNRFQLSKLFGNMDLIRAKSEEVIGSQFTPTDIYEIDRFIELESLEDFFKQAIPPVTFKKARYRKGSYIPPRLVLYVPHKEVYRNIKVIKKKPTLLLVNDYFTYDTEAVLDIKWSNMKSVEVYNTVQNLADQFGPRGEFGVIAFITRDGETPPSITETGNNLKVAGFYRPRLLTSIDYQSSYHQHSKIPDFRPTIYWNPQISLNQEAETLIRFPAGDQFGKYLIRVEGVSIHGSPVSAEAIFEVVY